MKFFLKNKKDVDSPEDIIPTDINSTGFSSVDLTPKSRIINWFTSNKKQAILLTIASLILLSGGTYALLNLSDKSDSEIISTQNVQDSDKQTKSDKKITSDDPNNPDEADSSSNSSTNQDASSTDTGSTNPTPTFNPQGTSEIKAPIGFVGCSNIRDTVQGYIAGGGTKFWTPPGGTYGGGTVYNWSDLSSSYWDSFDYMLAENPTTKTLWWGLCTFPSDKDSDATNSSASLIVLAELKKRIPGVTIYVSGMHDYVAPHYCRITGSDGPSRMKTLANSLVNNQGLKTGPTFGSLISYYQTPSSGATLANNQTKEDGCHPNDAGDLFLGSGLKSFFD